MNTSLYAIDVVQRLRRDAAARGFTIEEAPARDRNDLDVQLRALARAKPEAVVVVADSFLTANHGRIAQAMADNWLPAIYAYREAALGGGLNSYGTDYHELFRRAASYVDKILKGTNPGDVPVEQPTRFGLVLNLQTARILGLTVPPSLLARADEVIEVNPHTLRERPSAGRRPFFCLVPNTNGPLVSVPHLTAR